MPRAERRRTPDWLAHPLRWQRGPVPWSAMARGALGMGPLLGAGLAAGRPEVGLLAGLGALFAGINDRSGTRRVAAVQAGVPALGGALGLLLGFATGWWALPLLLTVGLLCGAASVAGPVCSAAALQLLVLTAVGSGMSIALPGWTRAAWFLAGAGWLMLLRLLSTVRPGRPAAGERLAVAAVFDALADALDAVGTPAAEPARRRLTAALDRADQALRLRRVLPLPARAATRTEVATLAARLAAAAALCEASVALLWEGERLPERIPTGPRRLAAAVRAGRNPGVLPAPNSDTPARTAFDRAVLQAGLVFAGTPAPDRPTPRRGPRGIHPASPAGREYGARVAVCVTASTAAALLLHTEHWFWLPATAAFLVKPDFGPLFSRVVNRFAGTALGVVLFAALTAATDRPWLPVATVAVAGALLPLAARHFALQTAAVTVTVLAFVSAAGDRQAAVSRLADTALACAIVLLAGHLPRLTDTRARVGHRSAQALRRTRSYLDHVLTDAPGPQTRTELRRSAYHALAEARTAAEGAAAELTAGPALDWLKVTEGAERIADAATACAVRIEHGSPRPAGPAARQVTAALDAMADALENGARHPTSAPDAAAPDAAAPGAHGPALTGPDCRTLDDILTELHRIRTLATAA
ncbi:FUSC family protein [Kitasatospora sp. MBT63]|uniref:FUSC family protein n=1 Tax=Kitasatospora sp. MBT63 TaxID=1444768 RepID=UPI00053A0A4E|nr:FUSC family protein [Kitasatospora sp. MBT63]